METLDEPSDLAHWGEQLLSAYDTWRAVADAGSTRDAVAGLLRTGTSITDCPRLLDLPWEDVLASFTGGHDDAATMGWSMEHWLWVEAVLHQEAHQMSARALGRRLGVHVETAQRLCILYGVQTDTLQRSRLDSMKYHLRLGATPRELTDRCAADGHIVTYNQAYQMRRKMIERGELVPADASRAALAVVA